MATIEKNWLCIKQLSELNTFTQPQIHHGQNGLKTVQGIKNTRNWWDWARRLKYKLYHSEQKQATYWWFWHKSECYTSWIWFQEKVCIHLFVSFLFIIFFLLLLLSVLVKKLKNFCLYTDPIFSLPPPYRIYVWLKIIYSSLLQVLHTNINTFYLEHNVLNKKLVFIRIYGTYKIF